MFHQWRQDCFAPYYKGILYITHGEFCHHLCAEDGHVISTTIDELCSSNEEANTRLLLHLFHVSHEEHRDSIIILIQYLLQFVYKAADIARTYYSEIL